MKWYRYNPDTLEYEHPVTCQPNPARLGEFLIPPSATELKPPSAGGHKVAVFQSDNSNWTVKPDYRGTEYWLPDGSQHKIEHIGEVPPDNALDQPLLDLCAVYQANGQARQQRIQREQQQQADVEFLKLKQQVAALTA